MLRVGDLVTVITLVVGIYEEGLVGRSGRIIGYLDPESYGLLEYDIKLEGGYIDGFNEEELQLL